MKVKPTVATVKKLRPMGWADYKHKLYRLGVISSPTSDVPTEWIEAFKKTFQT